MNLHVVAVFTFKESDVFDGLELLKKLVIATRKEAGCLQYDVVEDREIIGKVFLVELWETDEHHYNHGKQEHLSDFRRDVQHFLKSSTEVYRGFKIF